MKVVSGGQTGADRAGLDAALELGLEIGGFWPKGRRAEDGKVPSRYGLTPTSGSDYRDRTKMNAKHSDATLVFTFGPPSGGSAFSIRVARELGKPVLHVDLDSDDNFVEKIRAFLMEHHVEVLNIAGSRESTAPGIYNEVRGSFFWPSEKAPGGPVRHSSTTGSRAA